ncbi:peptidylprolyl isomerase [Candidatus Woesearchaeota archaeon]|nr:MAG: peptidylprolyl isomerase [Candidatus Woesearchaeota archaeon]
MSENTSEKKVAKQGSRVKVHYTGTLDSGEQFDSSRGREPLSFQIGAGQVIPGFEEEVVGMAKGDKKIFRLPPEKAYGERNEKLVQELPRESIQGKMELEEGKMIGLRAPTGEVLFAKVVKIDGDRVTLDLNPPLAGKALTFDVELVDVE